MAAIAALSLITAVAGTAAASGGFSRPVDTAPPGTSTTRVFAFTGHPESFTVPAGVTALDIVASGGHGGHSHADADGGPGIQVTALNVPVTPGEKFLVGVGGKGGSAVGGGKIPNTGEGGYNNGGSGARGGGGGGGFSYVQASNGVHIVLAGGGGGGSGGVGGPQNPPGTLDGQNGGGSLGTPRGGGGGTLTGGGAGGHNPSPLVGDGKGGSRYNGGTGGVGLLPKGSSGGGGGGGGYFGGGGGAGSEAGGGGGGGAGSSFVQPNVLTTVTPHPGNAEVRITYVRATTTTVQSKVNPTTFGDPVEYTATVTPTPAGGTVTFDDRNYNRPYAGCERLPLVGGIATCHAQFAIPGHYLVTARYTGDGDFRPSAGDLTGGQYVKSTTTVSLALAPRSKSPSKLHERVFFLAKVVPQNPTAAYPSGVVFLTVDGHRQFQAAFGASFEVQIPADFEGAGNHTVTATFDGDQQYHGSTSAPLEHQVSAGEAEPTTEQPAPTGQPATTEAPPGT